MRQIISLNSNWKFIKQDISEGSNRYCSVEGWESVNVPHTWNAIDGTNGFEYFKGACWYRKSFSLDAKVEGNRVFIEFQGANSITDVYVNGTYLGQHRGGYSTFRFDATDVITFGAENTLAVKVDNSIVDDVYPQMADFTFFGGIYRDVNLVIANPVHFDLLDFGSEGVYVIQEQVNDEKASLTIKSKLVNSHDQEKKVRLWAEIFDAEGCKVGYGVEEIVLAAGEATESCVPVTIHQPSLWNGRQNPYMYQAKVSFTSFNDILDELVIPFGVRYFEVDSKKGFFLNGKHLPLNGVSRHQDRKDMGWAITEQQQDEDIELIKEVGATSIRLAHYQHNQYFYDLCDREGMIVWAEIPFITIMNKNDSEGLNQKQQMTELIRQNFNHPSIMFWGIQNEIQISGERPELRKLVNELNELTKKEDPSRLTTMANVMFVPDNDEYNHVTDIIGYNKYYGWYQGKCEDFAEWLDGFHATNPNVKLGISEYGAEGIIEYHADEPQIKDYTEEYHAVFHEKVWSIFSKRPYLWGTYVWNMFDFGANIRDEGGVKGRNNKGLVTYDRRIKKDAFYMYKANWSNDKFVHIASKRFFERASETIAVKVYSNCDEVTLFLSGTELTTLQSEDRIFVFEHVSLQNGLNTIHAVGRSDNTSFEDTAIFNKVAEPNLSYELLEKKGGVVDNWFQMPDVEDTIIEELIITDYVLSSRCAIREIMDHPEGRKILEQYLGDFTENPMYEMLSGMKLDMIAGMATDVFTDKLMYSLNKSLTQIGKL